MSLLFFPSDNLEPHLAALLHPDLRRCVADDVNKAIITSQHQRRDATIRNLVRLRAWAENTSRDAKKDLPANMELGLDPGTSGASQAMDTHEDVMITSWVYVLWVEPLGTPRRLPGVRALPWEACSLHGHWELAFNIDAIALQIMKGSLYSVDADFKWILHEEQYVMTPVLVLHAPAICDQLRKCRFSSIAKMDHLSLLPD